MMKCVFDPKNAAAYRKRRGFTPPSPYKKYMCLTVKYKGTRIEVQVLSWNKTCIFVQGSNGTYAIAHSDVCWCSDEVWH